MVRDGKHGPAGSCSKFSFWSITSLVSEKKATIIHLSIVGAEMWVVLKISHWHLLGEEMGTEFRRAAERAGDYLSSHDLE